MASRIRQKRIHDALHLLARRSELLSLSCSRSARRISICRRFRDRAGRSGVIARGHL